LNDCEVSPLKVSDFDNTEDDGILFIRYVEICRLLGDLTECCDRGFLPSSKRFQIEGTLLRWLDEMPSRLRLPDIPSVDNFNSRQVHMPYLMSIMILSRFTAKGVSRTAILAASSCAGILEGFLSRDEVKFLAPVFTIYCISSGFTLLTLYRYPQLWSAAQADMNIILKSLSELSKHWRSAIGGLKAVQSAIQAKKRSGTVKQNLPLGLRIREWDAFFSYFPDHLCRLRAPYDAQIAEFPSFVGESSPVPIYEHQQNNDHSISDCQTPVSGRVHHSTFFPAVDLFGYDHFGSWLLNEPSIAALGGA
jgi:hypothetical protein